MFCRAVLFIHLEKTLIKQALLAISNTTGTKSMPGQIILCKNKSCRLQERLYGYIMKEGVRMSGTNRSMLVVRERMEEKQQCEQIELLYVIQGQMVLQTDRERYCLTEKDVLVLSQGEWYEWNTEAEKEETLLCKIFMDPYQMQHVQEGKRRKIVCNSVADPQKDYGRIQYVIDSMAKKYAENKNEFILKSLYYTLWEIIKNNFTEEYEEKEQNARIVEILQLIQEEYASPLSLKTLAEKYYMSESALSREFKKETGQNFLEYLRSIRLEKVREDLLYTEKNITKIAMDCGFTDVSVLNKNFRKVYGMSPGMYRKQKYEKQITDHSKAEAEMIATYLKQQEAGLDTKTGQEKEQTGEQRSTDSLRVFDVNQTHIVKDPHLKCINAGMAVDLLEAKVQKQIRFAVEELHFQYIRISNIFARELKIRPEHECDNLNFDKLDEIFDFLSDIGVYPFLELPEKQTKYVLDIGTGERIREKETEDVILSGEEWEQLLEQFLWHMIERYTLGTVDRWMFEIAEDIGMQTGAAKNILYEELYQISYTSIRRYLPNAKIGGCGRNRMMGEEELRERLLFWKEGDQKPDFLSFMSYPYRIETKEKLDTYKLLEMEVDQKFIKEDLEDYKLVMCQVDYPDTPIWITEWNTSLSERNSYNDSCAKAAHMLSQMTGLAGEVEGMCYWSISDCHARYFDKKEPLVGATGLLTKDGLCKPSYYAYEFWSFVGQKVIAKGEDYLISSRSRNEYNLILFHPQKFNEIYRTYTENEIGVKELPYIFENRERKWYSFLLKNLQNGMKKISIYHICEEEGNILAEWGKLGYLDSLNQFETEYLKKRCIPRMEVIRRKVTNQNLKLELELEPNEICLVFVL